MAALTSRRTASLPAFAMVWFAVVKKLSVEVVEGQSVVRMTFFFSAAKMLTAVA